MNEDEKIIICAGKSASLAIETAMIPLDRGSSAKEQARGLRNAALRSKLAKAKDMVDEVVAELEV